MKKRIAKLLTLVVVCSLSFTVVEADTGHAVNEVMEDASVTIDEIVLDKAPGIMEAARASGEYSNLDNSGTYYLGNSIPVYNYVDNMIEIASVKYYPVIFNENVR